LDGSGLAGGQDKRDFVDQRREEKFAALGVLGHRQAVAHHQRCRQHVAKIMIDLAHTGADGGKAGLLPKRRARTLLHDTKPALDNADFIAPAAPRHGRCGVLWRAPEGN